jgi:hypothetical protein
LVIGSDNIEALIYSSIYIALGKGECMATREQLLKYQKASRRLQLPLKGVLILGY